MAANAPGWEKWKKIEPHRLARYISPADIAEQFRTAPGQPQTLSRVGGATRFQLAANVYAHLQGFDLRYDQTQIDFADYHAGEQIVRTAQQVREDGGSCLDLSLVYAGLCEYVGLRPLLVILRGHTLVAVALSSDLDDAKPRSGLVPGEDNLLRQGLLGPEPGGKARLLALLNRAHPEKGNYVVVECTGLSTTDRLNGPAVPLSFAAAVTTGHDQLAGGELRNLVDIGFFHLQAGQGITPYPVRTTAGAPTRAEPALGPAGVARLTEMLEFAGVARPQRWTVTDLRALAPLVAGRPTPEQPLVADAVRDLTDSLITAGFILGWMPQALTTGAMRWALRLPGSPPAPAGRLETLADYLEHLALHHYGGQAGLRRWLASFVVRLAVGAGLDLDAEPVHRWAQELDIQVGLNDVAGLVRAERENSRARLIVSLHASVAGDWPEQVVAWWLLDGIPSEPRFEACKPTQAGLEAAIGRHLDWADEQADAHLLKLDRVEVAVPTGLLPHWRPEETDASEERLVQHYQVVTRWSDRLGRNTRVVRKRLHDIVAGGETPVHWLDRQATAELDRAVALVRDSVPARAAGLMFHPERHEATLRALLEQSPVLLWPDQDVETDEVLIAELYGCWPEVPGTLNDAYLNRQDPAKARPIAGLRAVWDDEDWLRFCRLFAGPRPRGSG